MNIENDTCYIKHYANSKKEFASLTHYLEVWDNAYLVDCYFVGNEDIYNEGACHSGVDPDDKYAGTYIMKKQYLRWTKHIQQAKETAVKMMRKVATPVNRNLRVGDNILYIWVDYEEDKEYRQDDEYIGMRIVDINDNSIYVQNIYIGKHYFDSSDEIRCFNDINEIQNNSYFITEEVFMATHDYIRDFCHQMLEETKSHVRQ